MAGKQYIADKETLDAIKALIGLINDTGGTATAGTLMAKANAAINYVLTNNSGSSTGNLSQKLSYIISTLLGTTGATGGSATAGTLSAKANKIINDLAGATTKLNDIITKIENNGGMIPYTLDLHKYNMTAHITSVKALFSTLTTSTKTLVNISGEGIVQTIAMYSFSGELKEKMQIHIFVDGIDYDFSPKIVTTASGQVRFGVYSNQNRDSSLIPNISQREDTPAILRFKRSLRVTYGLSSAITSTKLPSDTNNLLTVVYGLI